MQSRSNASSRQAAQASQAAVALHYADEDANTFADRSLASTSAATRQSATAGERGERDGGGGGWEGSARRWTAAEERRVRRRLDQLEKTNVVDPPFKEFKDGLNRPFKEFKDGLDLTASPSTSSAAAAAAAAGVAIVDESDEIDRPRPTKRARLTTAPPPPPPSTAIPIKQAEAASATKPVKSKMTSAVRTLLAPSNRRTLAELLADQPHAAYSSALSPAPLHPPRRFCLPCGDLSKYACGACGEGVCSLACKAKHEEDACGRG